MNFTRSIRQFIHKLSLQSRLILLLLLSGLLPLLVMGGATTFYAGYLLDLQIGNRLDDIATAIIEKQDRMMFDRVKDVQTFATSSEARTLAPIVLTPYMNQVVRTYSPLYPLVVVADKHGVIQATNSLGITNTSGLPSVLVGQSVEHTDWFQVWFEDPLPDGQSYMTDLHHDGLLVQVLPDAPYTIVLSYPIRNESNITIGVWGMFLDWRVVTALVDEALASPRAGGASTIDITLIDKEGRILISPIGAAVLRDFVPLSFVERRAIQDRTFSSTHNRSWFKPDRLAGAASSHGYSSYSGHGWIAIASQDRAEALKPVQTLWTSILVLGVLVALFIFGLGLIFGRATARPIEALTEAASRAADGDLDHQVPVTGDNEIGRLGRAFNHMVVQLRESQQTLEERIDKRTVDLQQALTTLQTTLDERDLLSDQLRESSIPLIPLIEHVAVLPVIGNLDNARARQLHETLLHGIEKETLQIVLIDITGVVVVDSHVAQTMLNAAQAAALLGCKVILVGIRPEVAQTLANLDFGGIPTHISLQAGLLAALREVGYTLTPHQRKAMGTQQHVGPR